MDDTVLRPSPVIWSGFHTEPITRITWNVFDLCRLPHRNRVLQDEHNNRDSAREKKNRSSQSRNRFSFLCSSCSGRKEMSFFSETITSRSDAMTLELLQTFHKSATVWSLMFYVTKDLKQHCWQNTVFARARKKAWSYPMSSRTTKVMRFLPHVSIIFSRVSSPSVTFCISKIHDQLQKRNKIRFACFVKRSSSKSIWTKVAFH